MGNSLVAGANLPIYYARMPEVIVRAKDTSDNRIVAAAQGSLQMDLQRQYEHCWRDNDAGFEVGYL